uniref:Interferon-induced GTP-binding protein Mx1 n=1 Tax=Lygus hesperus TaxID=30085 RepID=A0A0A9XDA5_LYGHE
MSVEPLGAVDRWIRVLLAYTLEHLGPLDVVQSMQVHASRTQRRMQHAMGSTPQHLAHQSVFFGDHVHHRLNDCAHEGFVHLQAVLHILGNKIRSIHTCSEAGG